MTVTSQAAEIIVYSRINEPIGLLNDYLELTAASKRDCPGTLEIVISGDDPFMPILLDFPNNGCWIETTIGSDLTQDWDPHSAQVSVLNGRYTCTINLAERTGPPVSRYPVTTAGGQP